MCDKNLGPAILERSTYITMSLTEHLHDTQTYTPLTEAEALSQLKNLRDETSSLFVQYSKSLLGTDIDYFWAFLLKIPEKLHIPQFYGMPKVHKNKLPVPLRPVIAQCGSFTAYISTWIDVKLQQLKNTLPSYIQNSTDLLNVIDNLPNLPENAKLVTTDATSMYTNISTEDGVKIVKEYLLLFQHEIDQSIPVDLLVSLIELVMKNNIFKFGDTWWHQKNGTAMGTPCACIYATLYFGFYERTLLLPKYKNNILLYKRQIDDILMIWIPNSPNNTEWNEFKRDLNSCSSLSWETETLSDSTHFLDLNIWIDKKDHKLAYSTYQKEMNLFLYIPPHSAHPNNTTKSLIYGLLKTYHRQNPNPSDFQQMSKLLFKRLQSRGHKHTNLKLLFKETLTKLTSPHSKLLIHKPSKISSPPTHHPISTTPKNNLFLHLQYHPKGISRQSIQQSYTQHCTSNTYKSQHSQHLNLSAIHNNNTINNTLHNAASLSSPTHHSPLQHKTPQTTTQRIGNTQNLITPPSQSSTSDSDPGFDQMYNPSSGVTMKIDKLTVAYSRPTNLRDILCPSTLFEFGNTSVSNISTQTKRAS